MIEFSQGRCFCLIDVLYVDKDIVVCIKPVGLISEAGDGSLPAALQEQLGLPVLAVHRLDTGVSGVMVYALNKPSAAELSRQMQNGTFVKEYLAVVRGAPSESSGTFTDLLFHDKRRNKSFVVDKERGGVKKAVLDYSVLKTDDTQGKQLSLVQIRLHTGRTHQIRVQFSSRGMPLYGDGKYGGRTEKEGIALLSHKISFNHPKNKKALSFTSSLPDGKVWKL